jgi:haloalkane dehalogenase
MKCLRTPDGRFANLPDFPFAPHYVDDLAGYEGVRVHYLDEGVDTGNGVALCLHGNPSWSYLYRKMIPVFVRAGLRVVAPDLIGFGRSDKPVDEAAHSFAFHRSILQRFIERLDLRNILLVVQDWGGIFGLTLPPLTPERFSRVLVMNTALAVGKDPGEGFKQWRAYSNTQSDLDVGRLIARGKPDMSAQEMAAYNAPFPDASYKAALRCFPNMVPDQPDAPGAAESREALNWWLTSWKGQSFMAIGMQDPVLGPAVMRQLHKLFSNCPPPLEIAEGGHFVQEWGAPIAQAALKHFRSA